MVSDLLIFQFSNLAARAYTPTFAPFQALFAVVSSARGLSARGRPSDHVPDVRPARRVSKQRIL